jgi:hypothetical protein
VFEVRILISILLNEFKEEKQNREKKFKIVMKKFLNYSPR